MDKRDHPKIGDLWVNKNKTIAFTVLDKEYSRGLKRWVLTVIVTGANGPEKATFDSKFTELGDYWTKL